jgi:Flp pilus assembly protein TadG
MNSLARNNSAVRSLERGFGAIGQSYAELLVAFPILLFMLVAGADFGRVFYTAVSLNNAARAAAQYGSQSVATAADSSGMVSAAEADGSNIPNISATASQCTCESGSSVSACPSGYCTYDSGATFVTVNVQAPFQTIFNYPGIPHSFTMSYQAIMQVQP